MMDKAIQHPSEIYLIELSQTAAIPSFLTLIRANLPSLWYSCLLQPTQWLQQWGFSEIFASLL